MMIFCSGVNDVFKLSECHRIDHGFGELGIGVQSRTSEICISGVECLVESPKASSQSFEVSMVLAVFYSSVIFGKLSDVDKVGVNLSSKGWS